MFLVKATKRKKKNFTKASGQTGDDKIQGGLVPLKGGLCRPLATAFMFAWSAPVLSYPSTAL